MDSGGRRRRWNKAWLRLLGEEKWAPDGIGDRGGVRALFMGTEILGRDGIEDRSSVGLNRRWHSVRLGHEQEEGDGSDSRARPVSYGGGLRGRGLRLAREPGRTSWAASSGLRRGRAWAGAGAGRAERCGERGAQAGAGKRWAAAAAGLRAKKRKEENSIFFQLLSKANFESKNSNQIQT